MFDLYQVSIAVGIATFVISATVGLLWLKKPTKYIGWICVGALLWAVIAISFSESMYDDRDANMRAALKPYGITVVGYEAWDTRVIVRNDHHAACVASYEIDGLMLTGVRWPLVAGTGEMRSGYCPQKLDAIFVTTW